MFKVFNITEISFDMTNRNILIIIKTKVTTVGIKLRLIYKRLHQVSCIELESQSVCLVSMKCYIEVQ